MPKLALPTTLIVAGLALLSVLPGLGLYGMLDPTDSFFIEAAREMLEVGHYVTPLFNYVNWLDKPALPFLLIVACYKIFGVCAWAARIPSAISAVILVVCTYRSSQLFFKPRAALFTALILCSTPLYLTVAHLALSDSPLTMFFGVAMLGFAQALLSEKPVSLIIAYVSLALAVLCKGPIGLVLVVGIVATYLAVSASSLKQLFGKVKRLQLGQGLIILLTVCLPYYWLAHISTNGGFTQEFFFHQNLGRFEGTINHQQPVWWYVPVFLAGFFPWTIVFLNAIPWLKSFSKRRQNLSRRQSFIVLSLVWLMFVFVFFSAIPTKLPTYIVPLCPAFAIVAGAYLETQWRLRKSRTVVMTAAAVLATTPLGLFLLEKTGFLTGKIGLLVVVTMVSIAIIAILTVILCSIKQLPRAVWSFILVAYASCAILVPTMLCQFYATHEKGIEDLIQIAKNKNANLATLFSTVPSTNFIFRRKIRVVSSLAELALYCQEGQSPHFLLATTNCLNIPELKAAQHTVGTTGKWYLLAVDGYLPEPNKDLPAYPEAPGFSAQFR